MTRIGVSDNQKFLVDEDGLPFFWLADTAWELFHRLDAAEAGQYFRTRSRQGFTVVKSVILAEQDGLRVPNRQGEIPFVDLDPLKPNEEYFKFVDECISMAEANGLYVGLLPTWGDKVTPIWGIGPVVFNEKNAYGYGKFLGERYKDRTNILWILGGDRPAWHENTDYRPIWREMARGITDGAGRETFMTYHPWGSSASTYAWLNDEKWLSMHMMQSGHGGGRDMPVWDWIERDLNLVPPRPTLDGEPNYEDHPVNPWPTYDPRNGYYTDYDVRKQVYRSVFAGGCGVTYGHHSMWQCLARDATPANHPAGEPFFTWGEALERPGARQMIHLKNLILSRPFLQRIPDQGFILSDKGRGGSHIRATRSLAGHYAFVYLPRPVSVTVKTGSLAGTSLKVWYYDPVSGEAIPAGSFPKRDEMTLTPPGHRPDWVLVFDNEAKKFGEPGK